MLYVSVFVFVRIVEVKDISMENAGNNEQTACKFVRSPLICCSFFLNHTMLEYLFVTLCNNKH